MLTFNNSLKAQLDACTNKTQWANALKTALSSGRRMRCFHDATSNAPDPFTTGTEFLNVGLTGTVTISAGDVTNLGKTSNTTIKTAADLLTGTAVLRITSGSNWMQGTLGLTRAAQIAAGVAEADVKAYDFTFTANPTASKGIALTKSISLRAPNWLPSGTGPTIPGNDPKTPAGIRVYTYANDDYSNPILAGTAYANVRDDDIVLERPYMAAQMGDIKVMRCADGAGVVVGTGGDCFRFAVRVFSTNAALNNELPAPTHHARVNCAPHGRWASFPFRANLNPAVDTMSPQAFKVELFAQDGTTLEWFEMFSTRVDGVPGTGKPINSKDHGINLIADPGYQPWWTCFMELIYSSHNTKPNQYASHFLPNMDEPALDFKQVSAYAASLDQHPGITRNYPWNGLMHWRVAPKWSRKLDTGFDTDIIDPYMGASQAARDNYRTQLVGTDYEPGSMGTHVWLMGPGGSRGDRCFWAHPLSIWANKRDGFRPHGNRPLEALAREFSKCYANHGVHWYTNLERGLGVDKAKTLNGDFCINDYYYGPPTQSYRTDNDNHAVRWMSIRNTNHLPEDGLYDKNGRNFANDYSRDDQHNQSNGADYAILFNNPHGVIESSQFFAAIKATAFNMSGSFYIGQYLKRQHAWYVGGHAKAWVCAAKHPTLFSSAEIEKSLAIHLERVYDSVHPVYVNGTDVFAQSLRNLGSVVEATTTDGVTSLSTHTDSKSFYMGLVLHFMKQTGLWDTMQAYSPKCAWVLDNMVICLAKQSVDAFLDCDGRVDNLGKWSLGFSYPSDAPKAPAGWAEFVPPVGLNDWIRTPDGEFGGVDWFNPPTYYDPGKIDVYNTKHLRAQFVYILKNFFSEFNYPRVDQAVAKVDKFYDDAYSGNQYFSYLFSYFGRPQAPAFVGPPSV